MIMNKHALATLFMPGCTYEATSLRQDGTTTPQRTRYIMHVSHRPDGSVRVYHRIDGCSNSNFILDGHQDVIRVSSTEIVVKWNDIATFSYRLISMPKQPIVEEHHVQS